MAENFRDKRNNLSEAKKCLEGSGDAEREIPPLELDPNLLVSTPHMVCDSPEGEKSIPYTISLDSIPAQEEKDINASTMQIEYEEDIEQNIFKNAENSISLSSLLEEEPIVKKDSLYLPEENFKEEQVQNIFSLEEYLQEDVQHALDIPVEEGNAGLTMDISKEEHPLVQETNAALTMDIPLQKNEEVTAQTIAFPPEEFIDAQKTMDIPLSHTTVSPSAQTIDIPYHDNSSNITAVSMNSQGSANPTLFDPEIQMVPETELTVVDMNLSGNANSETRIESAPETDITVIDPEVITPQTSTASISKAKTLAQEKTDKAPALSGAKTKDVTTIEGTRYKIGDVINNKYKIVQFLGKGGMGAVFKVEHLLLPSKKVFALKLMHAHLSKDNRFRMRFIREVEMAMEFTHEHAVQIRDFGETQDGSQYLTMDFSPGKPLNDIIQKEGPLAKQRALSITRQILLALKTAHDKGIGHRDLKPDNILIEDRAGKEHALVLDFGIAKILTETKEDQKLTQKATIGTPLYMSPEQASGEEVDMRTDIYSMGIILYQMITKQLPFTGSTRDVLLGHIVKPPPTPRSIRPDLDIPQALEDLILKALEKERGRRFSTAEEFIQAIEMLEAPEVKEEKIELKKKRSIFMPFSLVATILLALCGYFVYVQWEEQKNQEKEFQQFLAAFKIKEARQSLDRMQELFTIKWINQIIPVVYPEKQSYENLQKAFKDALESENLSDSFIVQVPLLLESLSSLVVDIEKIEGLYKNLKYSKASEESGKKNLAAGKFREAISDFEKAASFKKSSLLQKLLDISQEGIQGQQSWEKQEYDNAFGLLINCKNKSQNLGISMDFPILKELERKENIKLFCQVVQESISLRNFSDIKDKSIQEAKTRLTPMTEEEKAQVEALYHTYEEGRKRYLHLDSLIQLVQEGLSQKDFSDTKENLILNRKQQLDPLSGEEKQNFDLLYDEYKKEKRNANIIYLSKFIEEAILQGDFTEAKQNSIKIRRSQLDPLTEEEKQVVFPVYKRYIQEKKNATQEQVSKVSSKLLEMLDAGIQQYRSNQFYEAQRTLEEYFSKDGEKLMPSESTKRAAEYLGLAYYKTRNWLNAVKYFEKAFSSNPQAIAYYGLALYQQNQDRKALENINRALDLSHETTLKRELYEAKIAILTRSFSYEESQLFDALKKYFEIQSRPSLDYIKKLGYLYLRFGNKAQAVPLLVQYLEKNNWQDKSVVNTWLSLQNFQPLSSGSRWEYRVHNTGSIIHYTIGNSSMNRATVTDNTGQTEEWYIENSYLYKEGKRKILIMPVPLAWTSWQRDSLTVEILSVNETIRIMDKEGIQREYVCIVLKIYSNISPGNFTKEYYSAGIGEVKLERYRNDQKIFQRELVYYIVR